MSLEQLQAEMTRRLSQFAGLGAVVRFDFGTDGALTLDATQAPPVLGREGPTPRTTLKISVANLSKLISGQLSPMLAFTLGKLKVDGDLGIAMKLSSMLDD